ncbi:hypothetical protein H9P43_009319 [Blastocladiella emersonii ATCC 22665]|nr:hypothetical protein H9P43_009319 [Blastocladiella emersonii ATCC 22665]
MNDVSFKTAWDWPFLGDRVFRVEPYTDAELAANAARLIEHQHQLMTSNSELMGKAIEDGWCKLLDASRGPMLEYLLGHRSPHISLPPSTGAIRGGLGPDAWIRGGVNGLGLTVFHLLDLACREPLPFTDSKLPGEIRAAASAAFIRPGVPLDLTDADLAELAKHDRPERVVELLKLIDAQVVYQNLTIGLALGSDSAFVAANDPSHLSTVGNARRLLNWTLDDINTNLAHPRGIHFALDWVDSKFTQLGTTKGALDLYSRGAVGLIGEWYSSYTQPAASAMSSYGVFQCSGSATSDVLSNKKAFPTFFRTVAPDSYQGKFIADAAQYFGFEQVNLIYSSDTYGVSLAQTMQAEAAVVGVKVPRVFQVPVGGAPEDYARAIAGIADSPTRVTILIVHVDEIVSLGLAAYERGFGREWVWLGSEATVPLAAAIKTGAVSLTPNQAAFFNGFLFSWPTETAPGYPRYEAMVARWRATFGNEDILSSFSLFFASCLEAQARGFLKLVQQYGYATVAVRNTSASLAEFLVPFESMSGPVSYNSNGDRLGLFQVQNLQDGRLVPIYSMDNTGTFRSLAPPVFPDGTNSAPPWRPRYELVAPQYADSGVTAVLTACGVALFAVVVSAGILIRFRKARRVRHLGLPFLLVLCVGMAISLTTPFLMAGIPTPAKCIAQYATLVLGFSLSISSLWIRSFTLWRVFDRILAKSSSLRTSALFARMLALPAAQIILLYVAQALAPLGPTPVLSFSTEQFICASSTNPVLGEALIYAASSIDGVLLIMLAVVGVKIRHVHSSYRDTVFIGYAMHALVVAAVVTVPISILFQYQTVTAYYAKSIAILYSNAAILLFNVFRHVLALRSDANQANGEHLESQFNDSTSGHSRVTSGTDNSGSAIWANRNMNGKFPVKPVSGYWSRWEQLDVSILPLEGVLLVSHADRMRAGTCYFIKRVLLDPKPEDNPLCIAVSHPGASSILIQFQSEAERTRWVENLLVIGAQQDETSSSRHRRASIRKRKAAAGPPAATVTLGTVAAMTVDRDG